MTDTRTFHLGDILTVATGRFCTPNGMDGIYDLCAWMTGDKPMTHQLPRMSRECEPAIYEQHPDLRAITVPKFEGAADGMAWLGRMVEQYGERRTITPMAAVDHTSIEPVAEMRMMNPTAELVVFPGPGAER